MINEGWVCPKCGRVLAPNTMYCLWCCSGRGATTNTASGTPKSYLAKSLRYSQDGHEIEKTEPTISKMEQVDEPQTCSFSDCDNFKNPDYERCIECKRKQIKLKTEQTEREDE